MMSWILSLVCLTSVVLGGMAILVRDQTFSILLFSLFGLVLASVWIILQGPDVAMTEVGVGVGVSGILLLLVNQLIGHSRSDHQFQFSLQFLLTLAGVILLAIILLVSFVALPQLPGGTEKAERMIAFYQSKTYEWYGIKNIVNAILLGFRGIDTLGEIMVIMGAGLAVGSILDPLDSSHSVEPVSLNPLADWIVSLLLVVLLAVGFYLNGFQGGVVLAGSLYLLLIVKGAPHISDHRLRRMLETVMASGVILFILIGGVGLLEGQPWLDLRNTSVVPSSLCLELMKFSITLTVGSSLTYLFICILGTGVATE